MKIRVLVTLLAVALVAAACGDDDGGSASTPEEYFRLVADASERFADESDAAEPDFANSEDPAETGRIAFSALADSVEGFVDTLEDISPPADLSDLHDDAVAKGRDAARSARDLADAVAAVSTPEELAEAFAGAEAVAFTEALDAFGQTCVALQGAADERGIDIDLRCEG